MRPHRARLEATISESTGTLTAVLSDFFANGAATVSKRGSTFSVKWSDVKVNGYGPMPGHRALTLESGAPVAETFSWRGRRIDETGLFYLGARYYEPTSGRFISPDSLGHLGSMDLYSYANGDPVNYFDPDGRLHLALNVGSMEGVADFAKDTWDAWASLTAQGHLADMLVGQYVDNARSSLDDMLSPVISDFTTEQQYARIGGAFAGEVAPNFIPIAGLEKAAASVLARGQAWMVRTFPSLGKDLGQVAARWTARAGQWLDDVAPGLNPANLDFGRTYSGFPWPDYTPPHPLHPDSLPFPHPEGKVEFTGFDVDHRYSQTAFPELADDPKYWDLKPAVENRGPKAAAERDLMQYERDLMQRSGMTLDEVRQHVTQQEWDSIANTVWPTHHPRIRDR